MTSIVLVLALSMTMQLPDECIGVRTLQPSPFCFAAVFATNIESMAAAYRNEGDSVAAITSGSLEDGVRTIVYWNLERKRVARRACADLASFQVRSDSTAALIVDTFCTVTRAMIATDSARVADMLADLRSPERRTAVDRATTQATRRQHAEEMNRTFAAASMMLSFLLVRTDPATGRTSLLALRQDQHRWLVARFRSAAPAGGDSGVFGQVGTALAEWLTEDNWKFLPQR